MTHCLHHFAAILFHHTGYVAFQGVTEGIVSGQDKPALATFFNHRACRTVGQRIGVIHVVDVVRRAVLVGNTGRGRTGDDTQFVVFFQDVADGNGDRGSNQAGDQINVLVLHPAPGSTGGGIRAVTIIRADHFDLGAIDRATEVRDGHFQGCLAIGAGQVTIGAGHVGQVTDFNGVVGYLSLGSTHKHG